MHSTRNAHTQPARRHSNKQKPVVSSRQTDGVKRVGRLLARTCTAIVSYDVRTDTWSTSHSEAHSAFGPVLLAL